MSARSFTLEKRNQGNITVKRDFDGHIDIVLHETSVVIQKPDGQIVLNTNNWHTMTTKTAMNRAFDLLGVNAYIAQKKGQWLITIDGETVPYFDGMVIDKTKLEKLLKA